MQNDRKNEMHPVKKNFNFTRCPVFKYYRSGISYLPQLPCSKLRVKFVTDNLLEILPIYTLEGLTMQGQQRGFMSFLLFRDDGDKLTPDLTCPSNFPKKLFRSY